MVLFLCSDLASFAVGQTLSSMATPLIDLDFVFALGNQFERDQPENRSNKSNRVMTLPPEIEFHEDVHLFIYKPHGLLDEASVDRAVAVLADLEKSQNEPFNRFSDASAIDRVELNYHYVIQVSLYRVLTYADRLPVKSAMLATDSTVVHYFQLHAIITEDSPINVRIFRERQDAANWLGVPVERLAAKSANET